jgi:hypothetical protein
VRKSCSVRIRGVRIRDAETSAIGGCLDREFQNWSVPLLDAFAGGSMVLVVSELTRLEIGKTPPAVQAVVAHVPEPHCEFVEFTAEAAELAETYIRSGVIGAGMRVDAQHIATATVHRVDVLVSWNFKHIVNLQRIHGYNSVNLRLGYPLLEIRTPREVMADER